MGISIEDVLATAGTEAAAAADEADGEPIIFDGIGSIKGKATTQAKGKAKKAAEEDVDMEEDVPLLINRDLHNLQDVLDQADVVIQLLDARDPLAFRSSHLEELIAAKPGRNLLFVVNKIDSVPRESLSSWLAHLRTQHPTLPFRSSSAFLPAPVEQAVKTKGKGKASLVDALGASSIRTYLSELAKEKDGDEPLAVAVIGLTNVCLFSPLRHDILLKQSCAGWKELLHQLSSGHLCITYILISYIISRSNYHSYATRSHLGSVFAQNTINRHARFVVDITGGRRYYRLGCATGTGYLVEE